MNRYVAAIDQGTTSSRCMLFDAAGAVAAMAQKEHRQIYPQPGWVEHDGEEIWRNVEDVVGRALAKLGADATQVAGLGITNQRETTILWDRRTGRPIANAIVWQDTRTDRLIADLGAQEGQDRFRERTGLPLATYFSGPKIGWLLDRADGARAAAERGDILFGTMDSWIIWKLTGRHVTDVTNASRTLLMNLATLSWDETLLDAMRIPHAMLPEIRSSGEVYGPAADVLAGVPVAAALGDQQAALFGQTCFQPGEAKCTYGTGAFLLLNTGERPVASKKGLLSTVAYRIGEAAPVYALEGSVAVAGAVVQWLRDRLGIIGSAAEIETLATSVSDAGGCVFVPAFSGLFAPHWRPDARGVIAGLTAYVGRAHIARAALDAVAWQTREVIDAMRADSGEALSVLKVDGGMTANATFLQILADAIHAPVARPQMLETTVLGAAYAAGLVVGFWPDQASLRERWREDGRWTPEASDAARAAAYGQWKKAVAASLGWTT